jgi:gliding motility-associated-like protein
VGNASADIVSMYMNFEHSFMGDLVISLICPDGSSMALHQQNGAGTFLGEPVDIDTQPNDEGVGYDYWFSPTATNGTWAENAGGTLPSGTYESSQSWDLLEGCPLNGTWEIEICDMWGSDNGFIFDWTINFNSSLFPDPIVFTPVFGMGCDSTFWQGPSILNQSANCNNINIQPPTPGVETYTFVATNDFGCTYTHDVDITVVQGPIIQIATPMDYCGQTVALSGVVTNVTPGYTYNYSWSPANLLNNPNSPNTSLSSLDEETSFALTVQVFGGALQNCSATQNVVVGVLEPPVSAPLESYDICLGEVLALVPPEQPGGWNAFLYSWTHTYECDQPQTPIIETCTDVLGSQPGQEATEAGLYEVTISMPAPCVWTASADYEVFTEVCELIIPNVFSPNNDTRNDAFYVDGLDAYPLSTMRIYNRWGGLVFSSDDFGNSAGWRPAEGEAAEGTYYYVLGVARNTSELIVVDINGNNSYDAQGMKYFSGSFSLLR